MTTKKAAQPITMLAVGNQPGTIEAAGKTILELLSAARSEGAAVAACNALAAIAHAPQHTQITDCHFTGN